MCGAPGEVTEQQLREFTLSKTVILFSKEMIEMKKYSTVVFDFGWNIVKTH